jgi:hypothetical protein
MVVAAILAPNAAKPDTMCEQSTCHGEPRLACRLTCYDTVSTFCDNVSKEVYSKAELLNSISPMKSHCGVTSLWANARCRQKGQLRDNWQPRIVTPGSLGRQVSATSSTLAALTFLAGRPLRSAEFPTHTHSPVQALRQVSRRMSPLK